MFKYIYVFICVCIYKCSIYTYMQRTHRFVLSIRMCEEGAHTFLSFDKSITYSGQTAGKKKQKPADSIFLEPSYVLSTPSASRWLPSNPTRARR